MSRIGNKVVVIPEGVTVTQEGNNVTVKGPKGELTRTFSADIKMNIEGNEVTFTRPNDSKEMKTIHGTTRANFNNMVVGVSEGFQKALELIGVGYRAQLQGSKLVKGANKEEVGELAANIRGTRPPEPYKGKGIRYVGEYVRRKEGKTGK